MNDDESETSRDEYASSPLRPPSHSGMFNFLQLLKACGVQSNINAYAMILALQKIDPNTVIEENEIVWIEESKAALICCLINNEFKSEILPTINNYLIQSDCWQSLKASVSTRSPKFNPSTLNDVTKNGQEKDEIEHTSTTITHSPVHEPKYSPLINYDDQLEYDEIPSTPKNEKAIPMDSMNTDIDTTINHSDITTMLERSHFPIVSSSESQSSKFKDNVFSDEEDEEEGRLKKESEMNKKRKREEAVGKENEINKIRRQEEELRNEILKKQKLDETEEELDFDNDVLSQAIMAVYSHKPKEVSRKLNYT